MPVLMGGSGSSGSTMLIRKLNTHPDIFCGGELNFFNKQQLFEDWDKNKLKILPYLPYFSTQGWQIYRRSNLGRIDYGWTKKDIKKLLKESNSIDDFTKSYFEKLLKVNNANLWIEKTPSNCYSFKQFLENYPQGKVIHIVRNPLDSAASMYKKDPRVYYAVGTWLYNNSAALATSSSDRYYRVKYEDLIFDQENTFKRLCNFIGVDSSGINLGQLDAGNKDIQSWDNSPDSKISTSSMGKFDLLPSEIKDEIYTAFDCFEVSAAHQNKNSMAYSDYYKIIKELDYLDKVFPNKEIVSKLSQDLRKDKFMRTLKRYCTGGDYYPLTIKK